MKSEYSSDVDILYITINDEKVSDTDEVTTGLIVDYANDSKIVGVELLDATYWLRDSPESYITQKTFAGVRLSVRSDVKTIKVIGTEDPRIWISCDEDDKWIHIDISQSSTK